MGYMSTENDKRVLIAGAAGFMGQSIVKKFTLGSILISLLSFSL